MHDLSGRTALVVGGSSGIGRATAALMLDRGAAVWIAGRTQAKLDAALASFGADARAQSVALDMTDGASIKTGLSGIEDASLDALTVTASSAVHGPFSELAVEEARAMFDSKFWGPYRLARAALPKLRDGGAITFFSGVLSRRPGLNCSALGAVNAAVEGLARDLALELEPRLRVNCVSPGMVRTEAYAKVPADKREAMYEGTGASLPVGRVGLPEEIAEATVFAAFNTYLTGQVLDVDGGHTIRQYATR